jgi:phosphatidylserine/phosphatidylglycerophosphate/cardiolipin synthase-like enzyme
MALSIITVKLLLSQGRSTKMYKLWGRWQTEPAGLLTSRLFDQDTFYKAFIRDAANCGSEIIIESPFITTKRAANLLPILRKLTKRGVRVVINTRNPEEHDGIYRLQAYEAIENLQMLGALVLFTSGHHRKLAIVDGHILWEGSLNILSQNDSCELMRRIDSTELATQMKDFLHLKKFLR